MSDNTSISASFNKNMDYDFEIINNTVNDDDCSDDETNLAGQPPCQQARLVLQPFNNAVSNHPF
eukprot:41953-Ditylum_brightwellii.AAC.1